jgi:hypothetical protein
MADPFGRLHGRSLAAFCHEASRSLAWDRGYFGADGSVSLERLVEGMIGGPPDDPALRRPPAVVEAITALRGGQLGLIADGDDSWGHAVDLAVPPGLLRGDFVLVADSEARAYLCEWDAGEIGSRYYRPTFAPAASGVGLAPPGSWLRLIIAALTGRHHPLPDDDALDIAALVAEARALAPTAGRWGRPSKQAAARKVATRLAGDGKIKPGEIATLAETLRKLL